MKVKNGFVVCEVGGETVAVASGALAAQFNGMIRLKGTGEFLFKLLQEDTTEDVLAEALVLEYAIDKTLALKDVHRFVASLDQAGLIEK